MSLNILGGVAQGFEIKVPPKDLIRPMSVRLKRRIFDSHQHWQGKIFVDLCAGSGAVGLEAWSRGAEKLFLTEKSSRVFIYTQENIKKMQKSYKEESDQRPIQYRKDNGLTWLTQFITLYSSFTEEEKLNTVLFFAPPYAIHSLYSMVCESVTKEWFTGELWIESDRQKGLPIEKINSLLFEPRKIFEQGTTFVSLYDFSGS